MAARRRMIATPIWQPPSALGELLVASDGPGGDQLGDSGAFHDCMEALRAAYAFGDGAISGRRELRAMFNVVDVRPDLRDRGHGPLAHRPAPGLRRLVDKEDVVLNRRGKAAIRISFES